MLEIILSITSVVVMLVLIHFITDLFFSKIIAGKVSKRKETIILLIINLLKYGLWIIGILVILSILGIDTASILAGAGLIGILLGFALQKLLQDMINGFYIIIENQFVVGEYVEINGKSGCVLELGLKTTKILNYTGEVIIFSNGEINQVTNYSRYNSLMIIDLPVLNKNEYIKVYKIIEMVIKEFKHHNIKGDIKILGVQEINETIYKIRIQAETIPYAYFEVGRKLREELMKKLQEENILFLDLVIVK